MVAPNGEESRFIFGLGPEDRAELERRAAAAGMTVSEFIAEIIKRKLDKGDQPQGE
jgi:hypothetical protein